MVPDKVKLDASEEEMVEILLSPDEWQGDGWVNFDPDFSRGETARLRRNGWIEERGEGRQREYRMTAKGAAALAAYAPIVKDTPSHG